MVVALYLVSWIVIFQAYCMFCKKLVWLASITLYLKTPEIKPNIVVFK